jgi:hypothetical protein
MTHETFIFKNSTCIIGTQFKKIKFGDRFYYEHGDEDGSMTLEQLNEMRKTTLAEIICKNGNNKEIKQNAFEVIRYLLNYLKY